MLKIRYSKLRVCHCFEKLFWHFERFDKLSTPIFFVTQHFLVTSLIQSIMQFSLRKSAVASACCLSLFSVGASAGFWDEVAQTLPGGIATSSDGFFSAQLSGAREIMDNGRDGIAFGIYTEHPRFDYDNRDEENMWPFGGGVLRTVIDDRGNERSLFALVFSDSHYYPEPTFGYSWVARYPVSEKFHVGAGYLLGFTFREDFNWLPCPMPLPVIKAGTDDVGVYMTYIPITNVFFFYGTVTTDSKENRLFPTLAGSAFANKTEIYGAWMREKTDSATEQGFMVTSDTGVMMGIRHFVANNWAIDVNYTESEHDTKYQGQRTAYDHKVYSAALQYHVNLSRSLRAHAGLGIGYGKWEAKQGSQSEDSVFPVVQLGGTWAVTEHTRLLGGINLSFPRYHNLAPEGDVMFRPSPAHMYIGAGIAF